MSLVTSPSSFRPRNYTYNVFTSFHGPDVRKTLLSHMREQFKRNGISMFDDTKIERSATIAPALLEAIRESRISIVILSKKYASSSWCLDELVEILDCKEDMGQIVMTIFYGVDPSDVRKQTGKFGIAFDKTCAHKTEERQKWSIALKEVANIAGEDFLRWNNEANMIKKITRDVLDKKNATPCRDFDDMVGLEAHLKEMESLLDLDNDGVKMVAISGPAGIGKTTIARALHGRLSHRFQLSCFVYDLSGSYPSGLDEHGLKLHLQEQFLSKILNQSGMKISHLGAIKENLSDMRVLVFLDDVNNLKQLEALANETSWFGPGSRIIVTTENKELLKQHGVNNIYPVGFPSRKEALEILCRYAFRQTSPYQGFEELAESVTQLCGKLPLGLRVVGSSLRGEQVDKWEDVVSRLETILDRGIEDELRVGYESLDEYEQTLFLHIAVFFNNYTNDLVKTMLADSDRDVKYGLRILEDRSLIEIKTSTYGDQIVMHRLLQQVGKKATLTQKQRKILIDAQEICDVLEDAKGTRAVSGISFDLSNIDELSISERAFKRMPNLRFLTVFNSKDDGNYRWHIPEEMAFPCRLRLLEWEAYPSKSLPHKFHPEYLVKLYMRDSKLEKLWEGTQGLKNLKTMDLTASKHLKELPDLSNATSLMHLKLDYCESLVEIPSFFSQLHKLYELTMDGCINLQVIPAYMNLASLKNVSMSGCSRLRNYPLMSRSIIHLTEFTVGDVPHRVFSRFMHVSLFKSGKPEGYVHCPDNVLHLDLCGSDIESIPDCIKALHQLESLDVSRCRRLASLPKLPRSLLSLKACDCESLKTVFCPLNTPNAKLDFTNCFKLSQQARGAIIQHSFRCKSTQLPGREVPTEFVQRAKGHSLTVVLDGNRSYSGLVFCVVFHQTKTGGSTKLLCRHVGQRDLEHVDVPNFRNSLDIRTEHLRIFSYSFEELYRSEVTKTMTVEFSRESLGVDVDVDIVECGAKIWNQEESFEGEYRDRWPMTYKIKTVELVVLVVWFLTGLLSIFRLIYLFFNKR